MDSLAIALSAAAAGRTVSRDLKDFADHDESILKAGVFTLIVKGIDADEGDIEYIRAVLVGQIVLDEGSPPSAVEEAELLMIDDVRRFAQQVQGSRVLRGKFRQSAQIDAPYGFISGELRIGPFDFELGADASLTDFITFHAESQMDADPEAELVSEVTLPQ